MSAADVLLHAGGVLRVSCTIQTCADNLILEVVMRGAAACAGVVPHARGVLPVRSNHVVVRGSHHNNDAMDGGAATSVSSLLSRG